MESLFGSVVMEVISLIGMKYLLDFSKIVVVQIPFSSLVAIFCSKNQVMIEAMSSKSHFQKHTLRKGKTERFLLFLNHPNFKLGISNQLTSLEP